MSLVSDIITAAYRETNLIPLANVPNANQIAETLPLLNTLVLSTVGHEAGDRLHDLTIGGTYDESDYANNWVPVNARLVLNLSAPINTLYLDPNPKTGQRAAFVDVDNNLATYPLTINGNGRNIETLAAVTLNVSGDKREWLYRGDIGNWVKITSLVSTDQFPFPADFDDFFTTMLALRINPRYGQSIAPETGEILKRAKRNLVSRYRSKTEEYPDYVGIIGERRNGSFNVDKFGRGIYRWS